MVENQSMLRTLNIDMKYKRLVLWGMKMRWSMCTKWVKVRMWSEHISSETQESGVSSGWWEGLVSCPATERERRGRWKDRRILVVTLICLICKSLLTPYQKSLHLSLALPSLSVFLFSFLPDGNILRFFKSLFMLEMLTSLHVWKVFVTNLPENEV